MDISNNKFGLTSNNLKLIAAISMFFDHFGMVFFPYSSIFRIIGRLAFPIYAFMIAEGCRHTRNKKRYFLTIALMATVFQLIYFFVLGDIYQGILVTFSLSIAIIFSVDSLIKSKSVQNWILMILVICAALFFGIAMPIIFEKEGFIIDYGVFGIFLPVIIYFAPSKKSKLIFTAIFLAVMSIFSNPIQWWALLSVLLLALYNGERGKRKMKYFFYIFYPLHLVLIYGAYILISIIK